MINKDGTTNQTFTKKRAQGISSTGMLTNKPGTFYKPTPIRIDLTGGAGKPAPDFVNPDKIKEEMDRRYEESIQFRNQQAAAGGGGKVICMAYHQLGIIDDDLNRLDQAYGAWLMKTNPKWQKAYWRYARHIVKHLHREKWQNRLLLFVLTPLVKVWSQEMGYRMGGDYKHSPLGSVLMWMMVHFFMLLGDIRNTRLKVKRAISKRFKEVFDLA